MLLRGEERRWGIIVSTDLLSYMSRQTYGTGLAIYRMDLSCLLLTSEAQLAVLSKAEPLGATTV